MSSHKKLSLLRDILGSTQSASSRGEYLFYCPKCDHHKKKLSINLSKGYKCWVCDYRSSNIRRLIREYGSLSDMCTWDRITNGTDLSVYDNIFKREETKIEVSLPKEYVSLGNFSKSGILSLNAREYLRARGVDRDKILKWKIGYCSHGEYKNRVIIPSFNNDGELDYYIGRSYTGDWMTYKNPNVTKDIIFNQINVDWDSDVVLVEGIFDAFVADNSIPLLGSSLSEKSKLFQYIATHDTRIFVALDPDAKKKIYYLMKKMLMYDIEIYSIDVGSYKDVGDMTPKEFAVRKKTAVKMTNSTLLKWRLG